MTASDRFHAYLGQCPLVAILRGVRPAEVDAIGDALVAAGIGLIEVPLNSPDPLDSIARLAQRQAGRAMIGAGTVLREEQVAAVAEAGGTLIVSPNSDSRVIGAAERNGLVALPGFFTPTDALGAIEAGATALKLFPAEGSSPAVLKAMLAVLPPDIRVLAVGGITPDTMKPWMAVGAAGFGLGSALYKASMTADEVGRRAVAFITALARSAEKLPPVSR